MLAAPDRHAQRPTRIEKRFSTRWGLLGNSENQRAREEPELLDDPGLPLLGGFTLGSDRLTGSEVNTSPGLGALGQSG
jgi:hypothetical protein